MKRAYRCMFCLQHFAWTFLMANTVSMVLQPGRNPHCDSRRCASEMLAIRLFRTMIFPTICHASLVLEEGDDRSISKLLWHVESF